MEETQILVKESTFDIVSLVNNYFIDVVEIFIISIVFKLISNNNSYSTTYILLLRNSLMLGGLFVLLSVYNDNLKKTIKQGLLTSIGSTIFRVSIANNLTQII